MPDPTQNHPTSPVSSEGTGAESEPEAEAMVLPEDEPPKSGEWVDVEDVIANPTDEEIEEGNRLGREIHVDDDADSGLEDGGL